MKKFDINSLIASVALILAAIVISAGLVGPSFLNKPQGDSKSQNIQGCYEIAVGDEISGSIEENGWSVTKKQLNQELFDKCLKSKGI